jgi:hypothetical protein
MYELDGVTPAICDSFGAPARLGRKNRPLFYSLFTFSKASIKRLRQLCFQRGGLRRAATCARDAVQSVRRGGVIIGLRAAG